MNETYAAMTTRSITSVTYTIVISDGDGDCVSKEISWWHWRVTSDCWYAYLESLIPVLCHRVSHYRN